MFVRYLTAKVRQKLVNTSFMTYVTASLQLAPQMMYLSERWSDGILDKSRMRDNRTADEIVDDVFSRFGA